MVNKYENYQYKKVRLRSKIKVYRLKWRGKTPQRTKSFPQSLFKRMTLMIWLTTWSLCFWRPIAIVMFIQLDNNEHETNEERLCNTLYTNHNSTYNYIFAQTFITFFLNYTNMSHKPHSGKTQGRYPLFAAKRSQHLLNIYTASNKKNGTNRIKIYTHNNKNLYIPEGSNFSWLDSLPSCLSGWHFRHRQWGFLCDSRCCHSGHDVRHFLHQGPHLVIIESQHHQDNGSSKAHYCSLTHFRIHTSQCRLET